MNCITRVGVVTVVGLGMLAGCSKSSSTGGMATADNGTPTIKETDPATNPIAKAAYDFLDAVLKGDTQRASARLTPKAMQRIVDSGKQFSPPGLETASFKIGEVRSPSEDQAIVQCVLTDNSDGKPHSEEMCCLLRKVENDWRVSGIAYGTTPDQPWTLSDFETGQNMAIPRQTMSGLASNQGNSGQQQATGSQASTGVPTVTPPVAAPATPIVASRGGLGMPAVAPAASSPNGGQPSAPYTAQEPHDAARR